MVTPFFGVQEGFSKRIVFDLQSSNLNESKNAQCQRFFCKKKKKVLLRLHN